MASHGKLEGIVLGNFKASFVAFFLLIAGCQESDLWSGINSGHFINSYNQSAFKISGPCPSEGEPVVALWPNETGGQVLGQGDCIGKNFELNANLSGVEDGEVQLVLATREPQGKNRRKGQRLEQKFLASEKISFFKDTEFPELTVDFPREGDYINSWNESRWRIWGTCDGGKEISFSVEFQSVGTAACYDGRFVTELDLSAFDEGRLVLTAVIRDDAGNSYSYLARFIKDTIAPQHSITNIPQGSFVNGTLGKNFAIAGNCNEAGATVGLLDGPYPVGYAVCDGSRFEISTDLTWSGPQGPFSLISIIKDTAGNASNLRLNLFRDTLDPQIELIAPTHFVSQANQGQFVVAGSCDEPETAIRFFRGETALGSTVCEVGTGLEHKGHFRALLDLSQMPDGIFDLDVFVQDSVGNVAEAKFSVTKDTVSPRIAIDSPAAGSAINLHSMASVPIRGACGEPGAAISLVEGGPSGEVKSVLGQSSCINGRFQSELDLSAGPEGSIRVVAMLEDAVGNIGTSSLNLVKDSVVPAVTITHPSPESYVNVANAGSLKVAGTCDDLGARIQLFVQGQTLKTINCDGGEFSTHLDLTSYSNRSLVLRASIEDVAGNGSAFSINLHKDTEAPTVAMMAPLEGSFVNAAGASSVRVTGTCNDAGTKIRIFVGTQTLASAVCDRSRGFDADLDLSALPDGVLNVEASISDTAGNSSNASLGLVKDTVAPVLALTHPEAGSFVNAAGAGSVEVAGTCNDAGAQVRVSAGAQTLASAVCDGRGFDANLDLSALDDGAISLAARVVDAAGNASSVSRGLVKDSVAPTVAVIHPKMGSLVNAANVGSTKVVGNCNDPTAQIQISYGEQILAETACNGREFSAELDLSSLDDSTLNLGVSITDEAANSSYMSLDLVKDVVAPVAAIAHPTEGSFVNAAGVGSVKVTGTCNDAGAQVQISAGDQTLASAVCDGRGFSADLDLSALDDGAINLKASISDAAGNSGLVSLDLVKDITKPRISVTTPVAFVSLANQSKFMVMGTCDVSRANVRFSSQEMNLGSTNCIVEDGVIASGHFRAELDLAQIPDGLFELIVAIQDRAGNASQAHVSVAKDTIAPELVITGLSDGGTFVHSANETSVSLQGRCNEEGATILFSQVDVDTKNPRRQLGQIGCEQGAFLVELDLASSADGALSIMAIVRDAAGNRATSSLDLIKDSIAPKLAITSPAAGSFVNAAGVSSVKVEGACNDSEAQIQFSSSGEQLARVACDGLRFSTNLDLSLVDEGAFGLEASITDMAGNSSKTSLDLVKDTVAPTLAMAHPAVGSFINAVDAASVKVGGSCSDSEAQIKISSGGRMLVATRCDGGEFSAGLDLSYQGEGALNLEIEVTDMAGNSSRASLGLIKDTVAPAVALNHPAAGSYINAANAPSVKVKGTCDGPEAQVQISFSGQTLAAASCDGGEFSADLDLSSLDDGTLVLEASISDAAGNTGRFPLNVVKDTVGPDISIVAPVVFASLANQRKFIVVGTCDAPLANIRFSHGESDLGSTSCIADNGEDSGGHFRAELDLAQIPDGLFAVNAAIRDRASNASQVQLSITKDTVAPELVVTGLANGEKFVNSANQTSVPLQGRCNEAGATILFAEVEDATEEPSRQLGQVLCGGSGDFHAELDLSASSEGALGIVAVMRDAAGNKTASSLELMKDSVAPVVAFVHPVAGSFVNAANSGPVRASGTCDDSQAQIQISTGTHVLAVVACDGREFAADLDFASLAEGALDLEARIMDVAENSSSASLQLIKDSVTPVAEFTHPAANSFVNAASASAVRVEGICDDSQAQIQISTGGQTLVMASCDGGKFGADLDLSSQSEGILILGAMILDAAGNSSATLLGLIKDTVTPTLNITHPAAGDFVNAAEVASVRVSGTCDDSQAQVQISSGTQSLVVIACDGREFSADLDFSSLPQGAFDLKARIADKASNASSASLGLVKDTTTPTLSITHPAAGNFVNADNVRSVEMAGVCDDPLAQVQISVGAEVLATANCDGHKFSADLDLSSLDDGVIALKAIISDRANNSSSATVNLAKDALTPTLAIAHPEAGSFVNTGNVGAVKLSGVCDDQLAQIRISAGTQVLANADCDGHSFSTNLDLTSFNDGPLDLEASIADAAGNSSVASLNLMKDTVAPSLSATHPVEGSFINVDNVHSVKVAGTCDDQLIQIQVSINAQVVTTVGCDGSEFTTDLDLSAYREGDVALAIVARDEAGNTHRLTRAMVKDTVAPQISVIALAHFAGQINEKRFVVAGSCDFPGGSLQLSSNGNLLGSTDCTSALEGEALGHFRTILEVDQISDGVFTIDASAQDAAGNVFTTALSVVKDTVAPELAITGPAEESFVNSDNVSQVSFQGNCNEENGTIVFLNGDSDSEHFGDFLGQTFCQNGHFNIELDLSSVEEGALIVEARIQDEWGNIRSSKTSAFKDTTLPSNVVVDIQNMNVINQSNSKKFHIEGNCEEPDAVIRFSVGTEYLGETVCDGKSFDIILDLSSLPEGNTELVTAIEDTSGNLNNSSLKLIKDSVAPNFAIANPAAGSFVNVENEDSVVVSGTCNDPEAKVQISNGNQVLGTADCDGNAFSTELDLSSVQEGPVNLVVAIEDNAGNAAESSFGLIKDATAPMIAFTNPATNSFINAANANAVNVAGTCNDSKANIEITDGKQSLGKINCDGKAFKAVLDLSSSVEGAINLAATITDHADNSKTSSLAVIKDTIAPVIAFTVPVVDSWINSAHVMAVKIVGTCDDSKASIEITDGKQTLEKTSCDGSTFSAELDLSSHEEGNINLVAAIEDGAGNSSASTLRLAKDTTAPIIAFTHPTANSFVNAARANKVEIAGTCDDSKANIEITNGKQTLEKASCDGSAFSAELDLSSQGEGNINLVATIEDDAGNSGVATLRLAKDTTAPLVAFTGPIEDSFINSGNVNAVSVTGTCDDPKAQIEISDESQTLGQAKCDGSAFSAELDLSSHKEGAINLMATIRDSAGNSGKSSLGVVKDTMAPTVAFTHPVASSFVNAASVGVVEIAGTCNDSGAHIGIVAGKETLGKASCDGSAFGAKLDLNSHDEGIVNLVATIEDEAGNANTSSLKLIKDTAAPTIAFTRPATDSFVNAAGVNTVNVAGTCDDSNAQIEITDGSQTLGQAKCNGSTFGATLDLSSHKEGVINLVATIEDSAGNSEKSSLGIVKDTLAPGVAFTNPQTGHFVNSANANALNVKGTCDDSAASIEITDGGQILEKTNCDGSIFDTKIDLSSHQEGNINLVATIKDSAGNTKTSSVGVVKDTLAPTVAFTHPASDSFVNAANVKAVDIAGTCSEENNDIQVFDGDNILLGKTACQKGKFNLVLDTTLNAEGVLNLVAVIQDAAQNTGRAHLPLNKDTAVPVVVLEGPSPDSFINANNIKAVEATGQCDDKQAKISFSVGKNVLGNATCDGTRFTTTLDFSSYPEGKLSLATRVEDNAGNQSDSILNLSKDTVSPNIAITSPAVESFVNSYTVKSVTIAGNCNEKSGVVRLLHGTQVLAKGVCDGTDFSINTDLSSLKDGKLTLTVSVDDIAKNEARSDIVLLKDVSPPELAITLPYPRSFISAKEVNALKIVGTCSDAETQIYFSDEVKSLGSAVCDGKAFSTALDFTSTWEGALIFTAFTQDLAGNASRITLPLIKDTVSPTISITTPTGGSHINSGSMKSVKVSGACNDSQASVRLSESGRLLGRSACDGKKYSVDIDLSTIDKESLTLEVVITDVAGNSNLASINLTKDKSAPSIAFINPIDGFKITSANVRFPVMVSGHCNNSTSLIELAIDGKALKKGISCDGKKFSANVDFSSVSEGNKTLVANIVDPFGNSGQDDVKIVKNVRPFVSVWKTNSAHESIQLHLKKGGTFNFTVDWGDGSSVEHITSYDDEDIDHTYISPGKYTVVINGLCSGLDGSDNFGNNTGYRRQLTEILDLGNVGWTSLEAAFLGATQLVQVSGGDTSQVTSMKEMFRKARNVVLDTSSWETGNVTDMSYLFAGASRANPDVGQWDTGHVVNMEGMFYGAKNAIPETSNWKTGNVNNMKHLFAKAEKADPDVSGWDTSKVTTLEAMFYGAVSADPQVRDWKVGQVENMAQMFERATNANPDVELWDTSNVSNMMAMFAKASKANPNVSKWKTNKVTNMRSLFEDAANAAPEMSEWKTGNVITMRRMFKLAIKADPDVSKWDVSNVEDMNSMFEGAIKANPDVSQWKTSKVVNFMRIFAGATSAKPNVDQWDMGQAIFLLSMFDGAVNADPNMGQWDFRSGAIAVQNLLKGTGLSDEHYSQFLVHLNEKNPDFRPKTIRTEAQYHGSVANIRAQLLAKGWRIDDQGESP